MSHNKTIGLNIANYRKLLNLSQQALADYLNVNRVELSYYETGERSIPTIIASKMAKLFGVTEYDLHQEDAKVSQLNFAFRAQELTTKDLGSIAEFKAVALNYLKMKKRYNVAANIELEVKAARFRSMHSIGAQDPVRLRSLLSQLNVITIYKPLSGNFSGMAIKVVDGVHDPIRFMLVNSEHSIGKQHFTICHELYHLYIQADFDSASCYTGRYDRSDKEEYKADVFASYLLLPEFGVKSLIPIQELKKDKITLTTVIKLEQYFSCSRSAMLYRLKELSIISSKKYDEYKSDVKRSAILHGYSTSLYESGNKNLAIGDYGSLARELYESEKISQTNYLTLLLDLGMNADEIENLFDGEQEA